MKLCECGCGSPTQVARRTEQRHGYIKGQSLRFVHGHNQRGRPGHGPIKHGHTRFSGTPTPEYLAYRHAKDRCTYPDHKCWKDYGGRGIRFLFESFEQFYAELGPRPPGKDKRGRALYSLDRIDNDGNYEPGNVRWATRSQQQKNRRKAQTASA